jgi:hypothetical protein
MCHDPGGRSTGAPRDKPSRPPGERLLSPMSTIMAIAVVSLLTLATCIHPFVAHNSLTPSGPLAYCHALVNKIWPD